jgi:hypothetical protein
VRGIEGQQRPGELLGEALGSEVHDRPGG